MSSTVHIAAGPGGPLTGEFTGTERRTISEFSDSEHGNVKIEYRGAGRPVLAFQDPLRVFGGSTTPAARPSSESKVSFASQLDVIPNLDGRSFSPVDKWQKRKALCESCKIFFVGFAIVAGIFSFTLQTNSVAFRHAMQSRLESFINVQQSEVLYRTHTIEQMGILFTNGDVTDADFQIHTKKAVEFSQVYGIKAPNAFSWCPCVPPSRVAEVTNTTSKNLGFPLFIHSFSLTPNSPSQHSFPMALLGPSDGMKSDEKAYFGLLDISSDEGIKQFMAGAALKQSTTLHSFGSDLITDLVLFRPVFASKPQYSAGACNSFLGITPEQEAANPHAANFAGFLLSTFDNPDIQAKLCQRIIYDASAGASIKMLVHDMTGKVVVQVVTLKADADAGKDFPEYKRLKVSDETYMRLTKALDADDWSVCQYHFVSQVDLVDREFAIHICAERSLGFVLRQEFGVLVVCAVFIALICIAVYLRYSQFIRGASLQYRSHQLQKSEAALLQQRLGSTQEKAESLRKFMNATGHDIRSLLQTLQSCVEGVCGRFHLMQTELSQTDPERQKAIEWLISAQRTSLNALSMAVGNTISASFGAEEEPAWNKICFDLNDLLSQTVSQASALASITCPDVQCFIEAGPEFQGGLIIEGDPTAISDAVTNMLIHCLKRHASEPTPMGDAAFIAKKFVKVSARWELDLSAFNNLLGFPPSGDLALFNSVDMASSGGSSAPLPGSAMRSIVDQAKASAETGLEMQNFAGKRDPVFDLSVKQSGQLSVSAIVDRRQSFSRRSKQSSDGASAGFPSASAAMKGSFTNSLITTLAEVTEGDSTSVVSRSSTNSKARKLHGSSNSDNNEEGNSTTPDSAESSQRLPSCISESSMMDVVDGHYVPRERPVPSLTDGHAEDACQREIKRSSTLGPSLPQLAQKGSSNSFTGSSISQSSFMSNSAFLVNRTAPNINKDCDTGDFSERSNTGFGADRSKQQNEVGDSFKVHGSLVLEVRDNGPVMSEMELKHCFDLFGGRPNRHVSIPQRASAAKLESSASSTDMQHQQGEPRSFVRRRSGGDSNLHGGVVSEGLNLFFVKQFFESLGGKVHADSSPHRGNVLYCHLPCVTHMAAAQIQERASVGLSKVSSAQSSTAGAMRSHLDDTWCDCLHTKAPAFSKADVTVMICLPYPLGRVLASNMEALGCTVVIRESMDSMLAELSDKHMRYTCAFVDTEYFIGRPAAVQGIRGLRFLESQDQLKPLPLIAITAESSPDIQTGIKNIGFTAVLAKPVKLETLKRYISSSLRKRRISFRTVKAPGGQVLPSARDGGKPIARPSSHK